VFLLLFPLFYAPETVLAQDSFNIDEHEGKIVYVDFWASWCAPCRASFPFMQDMATRYPDDLIVVAINVDKNRSEADKFLEEFNTDFGIVYDAPGDLAKEFNLQGMPTSYLFNRSGELLGSHVGFKLKDIKELEQVIASAIAGKD
jgi:cytochrome c biogenesis protein CcmG/thiol:disulfide interchange protein DsbE